MRFQLNPFTDKLDISGMGPGGTSVDFLTGNSGGAVGADSSFNINLLGDNATGINVVGNPGTNTLTFFGITPTTTQIGTTRYATNAEAAAQTIGTAALTPANITSFFSSSSLPSSQGGTGLSSPFAHSLIVTNGSSNYTVLGVASNGQLPIGSIGGDPVLSTLTAGAGVTITNGPGTITIALAGGGVGIDSIGTQTGTNPIAPDGTGLVTINGAVVAAGTNPVRSDGTGANTMAIEVQTSQAIAAADATKIGLSNFDSSSFAVAATGFVTLSGTGAGKTITGDTGGALSPTSNNWNLLGSGSITTAGSGSTLTTQLTGLTNHSVLVGAGTSTITKLAVGTNGQVLIGSSAADPTFGTLTSSDSSISFTTGAGTLSLQVAGGSTVIKTITGDTGGAESPSAGNFNILGSGSITTAGSANTETVQLTGLTNHAVLVGAGTSTITKIAATANTGAVLQNNSGADPSYSTATYPSTTTVSQLLYSSATNTVSGLSTANNGTLVTSATGVPSILAGPGTTGNILQSNAAAAPSFSTATYPSTTTINQLLYSSSNNVVAGITAANNGTLISGTTGVPSWLANGTTGQLLTATTGSPPSWTTITTGGDVVGPGSATDNALVRFDGTTGKLIQNGVITEDDTGNLSITASVSGGTLSTTISNTSNTASATALLQTTVAGGTAADAIHTFTVTGGNSASIGVDNSDSDRWKMSYSTALGTTDTIIADATGGQYKGYNTNTTPASGFIGEQIRATVAANGNSISNNTATNLTSINLTAGIWDVSLVMGFAGMTTGTALRCSISTTSATEGTSGDNRLDFPFQSQAAQNVAFSIPSYRIEISTTTTVYAVGFASYTVGTGTFFGRISGTRVG